MKKEKYERIVLEVVAFEVEDIITESPLAGIYGTDKANYGLGAVYEE